MANTQISELATTKTSGTIDADAEYIAAEPVAGTSYKTLITEAVAAGLAQATAALTIADDVNIAGDLAVQSSASENPITAKNSSGATIFAVSDSGGYNRASISSKDNGALRGPFLFIGQNTNASTPSPGYLALTRATGGSTIALYPDDSGLWRTQAGAITNGNYASGTVVGAQTSMAAAKDIMPGLSAIDEVAARIQAGADAVRKFAYKSGAYNRQMFEGVVVDEAPEYGMDRDDEHPAGKLLNEVQIIGDLLRMVADLAQRVAELEAK